MLQPCRGLALGQRNHSTRPARSRIHTCHRLVTHLGRVLRQVHRCRCSVPQVWWLGLRRCLYVRDQRRRRTTWPPGAISSSWSWSRTGWRFGCRRCAPCGSYGPSPTVRERVARRRALEPFRGAFPRADGEATLLPGSADTAGSRQIDILEDDDEVNQEVT